MNTSMFFTIVIRIKALNLDWLALVSSTQKCNRNGHGSPNWVEGLLDYFRFIDRSCGVIVIDPTEEKEGIALRECVFLIQVSCGVGQNEHFVSYFHWFSRNGHSAVLLAQVNVASSSGSHELSNTDAHAADEVLLVYGVSLGVSLEIPVVDTEHQHL